MKKAVFFLFVLLYALPGLAYALQVKGSGHIVKETRTVADFDRIRVSGAYDLHITQDPRQSLEIETDDNIMKHMRTRVIQGELVIDLQPDVISIEQSRSIIVRIQMAQLGRLDVTGVASANINTLRTDKLRVTVDGVGGITCRNLQVRDLDVMIGGSGNITFAGNAEKQNIVIGGNGNYRAGDLKGRSARIEINGTGNAEVWTEDSLDVTINGVGDISYYGDPRDIRKTIHGVGGVKKLGSRK